MGSTRILIGNFSWKRSDRKARRPDGITMLYDSFTQQECMTFRCSISIATGFFFPQLKPFFPNYVFFFFN